MNSSHETNPEEQANPKRSRFREIVRKFFLVIGIVLGLFIGYSIIRELVILVL